MKKIVILTGAGISAESGLGTFRDEGGLWAQHRIEDVATPEGFARNPDLVHDFYNARRAQARTAKPNEAHVALAKLEREFQGELILVTQNVDSLHAAAGSQHVMHMHGFLDGALCASCDARWPAPLAMNKTMKCPTCAAQTTRPDIVWFGEMPYQMDEIYHHLSEADLFAAIGTSGNVYPAAGFVQEASAFGALTVELNLEPSAVVSQFEQTIFGKASACVPEWVESLL
ncbi:NAD-dependent deacylase [Planktotalea sp.]|uniref:NAD-dependent deacylase n=1 Tax=Planktotalea sp. TaxID=2029877 RepID=UPI00329757CD